VARRLYGAVGGSLPFLGVDSWRWQYFENQPCPEDLIIPVDDATAWQIFPGHRWVYNKLSICESQGVPHGPHGTEPPRFPVFSKPIFNMKGMGIGSRVIATRRDYEASIEPGHMWMPLFGGAHVSTDVAVARGKPCWWRHTTGKPGPRATFDFWTIHAGSRPALERRIGAWVEERLAGFSGIVNFETIGGRIIECHLRMSEQWLDLNGPGWLEAVVRLYAEGVWEFDDSDRRTGYSVVLFGAHGVQWQPPAARVADLLRRPHISSIQITFEADKPPELHSMPPGGFRLAIVNCRDLDAGRAVRAELKRLFRGVVVGSASSARKDGALKRA
jgi:hypothetical protein